MTRRPLTGKVWASCLRCGYVELRVGQVTLHECLDPVQNTYRFRCPTCSSVTVKTANPGVVMLLRRCGVEREPVPRLRELEDRTRHAGDQQSGTAAKQGLLAHVSVVALAARLHLSDWDPYCCPLESLFG